MNREMTVRYHFPPYGSKEYMMADSVLFVRGRVDGRIRIGVLEFDDEDDASKESYEEMNTVMDMSEVIRLRDWLTKWIDGGVL